MLCLIESRMALLSRFLPWLLKSLDVAVYLKYNLACIVEKQPIEPPPASALEGSGHG
jgi:hypothetical protein